MEKNKIVPTWVSVIMLVLLVSGTALNVVSMVTFNYIDFPKALDCVACLLALAYCLKGYNKNAAGFFKVFCVAYCISCMMPIFVLVPFLADGSTVALYINMVFHLLIFACLSVFVAASDLGKRKSYVMAWIILICQLMSFLLSLINNMDIYFFIMGMMGKVILAVVFLIMIYAKYKDKAARGTK